MQFIVNPRVAEWLGAAPRKIITSKFTVEVNFLWKRTVDSLKTSFHLKSTVVDESLSSMNQQFRSRENQLLQLLQQNEKSTSIQNLSLKQSICNINKCSMSVYFRVASLRLLRQQILEMSHLTPEDRTVLIRVYLAILLLQHAIER